MREPVFDAPPLRAVTFTPFHGLPVLLAAIAVAAVRVPPEVYNGDEEAPLSDGDITRDPQCPGALTCALPHRAHG